MEIKSKDAGKLAACPFCGGSARMSRRQMRFYGTNALGEMKIRLGVQAICCRCKARGPLYAATVIVPGSESHIEWMEDRAAAWWSAWKENAVEGVEIEWCPRRLQKVCDTMTSKAATVRQGQSKVDEVEE